MSEQLFKYCFRGPDGHWVYGRIPGETQRHAEETLKFMGIPFEKVEAYDAMNPQIQPPPTTPVDLGPVVIPPAHVNPVMTMQHISETAQKMSKASLDDKERRPAHWRQRLFVDEPNKILSIVDELLEHKNGNVRDIGMIVDGKGKVVCSVLVEYDAEKEKQK